MQMLWQIFQKKSDWKCLSRMANGQRITVFAIPPLNFIYVIMKLYFITNNPMNVEDCRAIVQIIDYSNGQMKNISASIIVDTDLMSGDAIDLNNDMLTGLNPSEQLAQ